MSAAQQGSPSSLQFVRSQGPSTMEAFGGWLGLKFSPTLLTGRELELWEETRPPPRLPHPGHCAHSSSSSSARPPRHATPRIASHASHCVSWIELEFKTHFVEDKFFSWCTNWVGYVPAVCVHASRVSLSSTRGGSAGRWLHSQTIPGDQPDLEQTSCFLSLSWSSFAAPLYSPPHPGDYVHGRPAKQASEAPSIEILHRETGDKVFGERLARLLASVWVLTRWSTSSSPGSAT
jgi:hypothetical protein